MTVERDIRKLGLRHTFFLWNQMRVNEKAANRLQPQFPCRWANEGE